MKELLTFEGKSLEIHEEDGAEFFSKLPLSLQHLIFSQSSDRHSFFTLPAFSFMVKLVS